jgi:hypothetical protein
MTEMTSVGTDRGLEMEKEDKKELRQYLILASHPLAPGDITFGTFATSEDDAYENIKFSLVRNGKGIINLSNINKMTFRIIGIQTEKDFLYAKAKKGAVNAWTFGP